MTAPSTVSIQPFSRRDWRPLALAAGVLLLAFWPSVRAFPAVWAANRAHGYVAAALCALLIWRRRDALLTRSETPAWSTPVLIGLSLLWVAADVTSMQALHQLLLPAILLAWCLTAFGVDSAVAATPIAGAFVLAVPVWEVLNWPLQRMAAEVNGAVLRLAGMRVQIDAESIHIPWGTLVVANSCSGLSYLMVSLTIAVAYSLLYAASWGARLRLVVGATVAAILANWIRVGGLTVIAYRTHMQSSLMHDHELFGWVIYAVTMALFFWMIPRLERHAAAGAGRTDRALGSWRPVGNASPRGPLAATALAAAFPLLGLLNASIPDADRAPQSIPGIVAPTDWAVASAASPTRGWTPDERGATERRAQLYTRANDTIVVDRVIFHRQDQGAELIGGANRIAADSVLLGDRLVGPLDRNARLVRQAGVREQQRVRLVWYWYRIGGIETPSEATAKLLQLLAFVRRQPVSELVTVSTSCVGTDCNAATRSLYEFVTGTALPASSAP